MDSFIVDSYSGLVYIEWSGPSKKLYILDHVILRVIFAEQRRSGSLRSRGPREVVRAKIYFVFAV